MKIIIKMPYFVLSNEAGREYCHGYLECLPKDIIEKLENGYMLSMWDIQGKDLNKLLDDNGRNHTSFAFNETCEILDIGDYL